MLQGLDASGKDGTISRVFRGLNPLGTRVAAFKAPSVEELGHDFLWRVHARCPSAGEIAIFNRSHYEDVLVVRVHGLVPEPVWRRRYAHINAFEALLADAGTSVVKILLHVSKAEQLERLEKRRDDPSKRWKLNEDDLAERALWDDYVAAFDEMLSKTSTKDRTVVRRAGGPQVVPRLGRVDDPRRRADRDGPALPRPAVGSPLTGPSGP